MAALLQLARVASGGLVALGLAQGLSLSLDGDGHSVTTYTALYGGAAVFAVVFVLLWLVIERRKRHDLGYGRRPRSPEAHARCIDGELATSDLLAGQALSAGRWWDVNATGLQSEMWKAGSDSLPASTHKAVLPAYAAVGVANAGANSAEHQRDRALSRSHRTQLEALRGAIETARNALSPPDEQPPPAEPPVEPEPPPASPPASKAVLDQQTSESSPLRSQLQALYNEGERIHSALPSPLTPMLSTLLVTTPSTAQDVDGWEAEVELALQREPKLQAVFMREPPKSRPWLISGVVNQLGFSPLRDRMSTRLSQLAKVIQAV